MTDTPDYTKWFALAGEENSPVALSETPFQAGDVIASGSGNRNQDPPTHAVSNDISIQVNVPYAEDEEGNPVKGVHRHPRVGNNVVIYAGATILGGDTCIGDNSVIGGSVWLTKSVPAGSRIYNR